MGDSPWGLLLAWEGAGGLGLARGGGTQLAAALLILGVPVTRPVNRNIPS